MIFTIIWDGFLLLVLLLILIYVGFMIAVLTEPFRRDPMRDAQRQAQLAQAREEAAARATKQRMGLLRQWANERISEQTRQGQRGQP